MKKKDIDDIVAEIDEKYFSHLESRDPNRIDRIIEQLRAHWKSSPDQRLGQLLASLSSVEDLDIFYWEDAELETALIAEARKAKGK